VELLNQKYDIHEAEDEACPEWSAGSINFLPSLLAVEKSILQACLDLSVHCDGYKTAMPLKFYMGTLTM
jgi:hypothetical protein